METNNQASNIIHYIEYLPANLQADPLLNQFLLAFENVISTSSSLGANDTSDTTPKGLEEYINSLHTYFNPGEKAGEDTAPREFLPWLANWVALSLRQDWSEETKRQFIRQIVPMYRRRGTKTGMEEILRLYLKSSNLSEDVEIWEFDEPPYYFQVQVTLPGAGWSLFWRQTRITKAIIEQEKPAHTYFAFRIVVPTMRITGNNFPFNLTKTGQIEVKVEKETEVVLITSIKSNSTQLKPAKVQKIPGQKSDILTYNINQEILNLSEYWYVSLENLSDTPVQCKITIKYTEDQSVILQKDFELHSGLKICTKSAEGNIEGNTLIGTHRGEITQKPVS